MSGSLSVCGVCWYGLSERMRGTVLARVVAASLNRAISRCAIHGSFSLQREPRETRGEGESGREGGEG